MEYDFVVTNQTTTIIQDISFETTLPETINLFGIKVKLPYDTSKIVLTDVSGNQYTWHFPFDTENSPEIFPTAIASAFFMDASGNTEEIKELIDASGLTFETSLTKTINLFGIKVEVPYNTSQIVLKDVSENTYTWEVPFEQSNFPNIGPNNVVVSAFFMDMCGNTQEISGNFIAYNVGAIESTRNYYVQLKANINEDIYQDAEGNYGLYGAIIDKDNTNYDISYCLPKGESSLPIKILPIYDYNNQDTLLGVFNLMLDISTNEFGEINSNVYFQSSTIDISTNSTNTISPTKIITSLENYYSTKIDNINSIYNNKNVITEWEMKILDAKPSPNSIVNQINAYSGGTRSLPNFFEDGEHITLAIGNELKLDIGDMQGQKINIIPPTLIYAVITQNSNAPRLNIGKPPHTR